ncbi:hypothetical protein H311_02296, partial [Anncaliia algerae PRA109]
NKYEFNYEIIFDKCKYVFNANENEEGNKTVHLNETIIKYLNNLEYKEYFFTCNDKEVRTLMHTLLKLHPMIYTFSDGCYFKIKTCLIQNYSFILKKINKDTSDVKNLLERHLSNTIDPVYKDNESEGLFTNELLNKYDILEDTRSNISCKVSFAGNKDKKAITYQRMNVKCNFISLFMLHLNNIEIFDIRRYNKGIDLGELYGNKFIIKVKLGDAMSKEDVNALIENHLNENAIMENGKLYFKSAKFINYFGMQRFGRSKNNHVIGELFHNGKVNEGITLILMTFINSRKESELMHKLLEEKDYNSLLKLTPHSFFLERKIFYLLMKNQKIVLNKLPRETIMLYFHSYQSYLFNNEVNIFLESLKDDAQTKKEFDIFVKKDEEFVQNENANLDEVYLKLHKLNNKLAKGDFRRIISTAYDVFIKYSNDEVIFEFTLEKGIYATMFLREFINSKE